MKRNLSWPALILSTLTIISCVPYNPAPPANGQSYYTAPQRNFTPPSQRESSQSAPVTPTPIPPPVQQTRPAPAPTSDWLFSPPTAQPPLQTIPERPQATASSPLARRGLEPGTVISPHPPYNILDVSEYQSGQKVCDPSTIPIDPTTGKQYIDPRTGVLDVSRGKSFIVP